MKIQRQNNINKLTEFKNFDNKSYIIEKKYQ